MVLCKPQMFIRVYFIMCQVAITQVLTLVILKTSFYVCCSVFLAASHVGAGTMRVVWVSYCHTQDKLHSLCLATGTVKGNSPLMAELSRAS